MRYVIDTSALVAVIANEPTKGELVRVTRGCDLVAPSSVHWEIGNAFAAGLRRNRFSLSQALKALDVYGKVPIRFVDVDLGDALGLAQRLRIYAYDAYVLACAEAQRCPVLSLDRGLRNAAVKLGLAVVEVAL